MTMNRRSLITGLISLVAAPTIVRASSLMPVRVVDNDVVWLLTWSGDGDLYVVRAVHVDASATWCQLESVHPLEDGRRLVTSLWNLGADYALGDVVRFPR